MESKWVQLPPKHTFNTQLLIKAEGRDQRTIAGDRRSQIPDELKG